MSFNKIIPFQSSTGRKFLIQFKKITLQEFSLPVIDVSLVLVESTNKNLELKDLIAITRIVKEFLIENEVILYYYCDTSDSDIIISEKNRTMKPQEFRHSLFNALFTFMKVTDFVKDEIIIEDPQNNSHYISLITKTENKSSLTEVSIAVQKINDK